MTIPGTTRPAATAAVLLPILIIATLAHPAPASAGNALRIEGWAENAAAGGASEGAHAWISHGIYKGGLELGLGKSQSAGAAFAVMAAWEVCEVREMDAKGVSVQDLVANAAGIAAGLAGLDVRYSYATYRRPEPTEECPWIGIPILPRNNTTYAIELRRDEWTLGYKYLEKTGDIVIGTTSMPVFAGERGEERVVGYVGREWGNGLHCAVGYDGLGELSAGAGYRASLWGLGLDVNSLIDDDGLRLGLSCFLDYGPMIGR
ncbi:MAG: hypothetical protein GF400_04600 [Candidatus Eisenbacteria bacterium]|nr:hypothetical protein [Candidatus Eisenbacteria bacterium]